jgi:MFS family permease
VRRLLSFVCVVVFVDTLFYAAITPILPELSDEYGLSKTAAGVLAAAYPAGTFAGALPGGWMAARAGVRPTVLFGLGLMVVSSLGFAFGDTIVVLDVSRFVQGIGGACSWAGALGWLLGAAPRDRRGQYIGTALAAAVAGALFGPVLGAAAGALGQEPVFGAVAVVGVGLMALALQMEAEEPEGDARLSTLLGSLSDRRVAAGMWLTTLPGLLFGTVAVLGPLRLDELGAGATAIAAAFLAAAAIEAIVAPMIGRLSDRRGRFLPSLIGVAGGGLIMLLLPWPESSWGLGVLIVLAGPSIGLLYTPAMAMLSDGADHAGVSQGFAFALVNLAWATGQTAGAAGSARLADATDDHVPYLVLAAVCAVTLVVLLRRRAVRLDGR